MKLTKNFSKSEFECKDGSKMPEDVFENVKELAFNLQIIRDCIERPINLTNAYRSLSHNRSIGSKDTSQHIKGKAADLQVDGIEPNYLYTIIEDLILKGKIKQGGLGLYNTFVHYDIFFDGVNKRRW
jgi:uncharacterized protein YcbK (DUF882 family)